MQISHSNISSRQILQNSNRNEALLQDGSRNRARLEAEPAVTPVNDKSAEELFQRRVELNKTASQNRISQQATDGLPRHNQQAIQAFENNRPTIEQQLGIEIVGIDTYA